MSDTRSPRPSVGRMSGKDGPQLANYKTFGEALAERQAYRRDVRRLTANITDAKRKALDAQRQPAQRPSAITPEDKAAIAAAARKAMDNYLRGKAFDAQRLQPTARQLRKADQPAQRPSVETQAGGWLDFVRSGRMVTLGADGQVITRKARDFERVESLNVPTDGRRARLEHKDLTLSGVGLSAGAAINVGNMVQIKGYLARFNNVDLSDDVCVPGCFSATIAAAAAARQTRGAKYLWPLLLAHDSDRPIGGILDAVEDSTGLLIEAWIDLDVADGRAAYSAVTKQYGAGLSIGYIAERTHYSANGVRELLRVSVLEGSVVAIPANPLATVTYAAPAPSLGAYN